MNWCLLVALPFDGFDWAIFGFYHSNAISVVECLLTKLSAKFPQLHSIIFFFFLILAQRHHLISRVFSKLAISWFELCNRLQLFLLKFTRVQISWLQSDRDESEFFTGSVTIASGWIRFVVRKILAMFHSSVSDHNCDILQPNIFQIGLFFLMFHLTVFYHNCAIRQTNFHANKLEKFLVFFF